MQGARSARIRYLWRSRNAEPVMRQVKCSVLSVQTKNSSFEERKTFRIITRALYRPARPRPSHLFPGRSHSETKCSSVWRHTLFPLSFRDRSFLILNRPILAVFCQQLASRYSFWRYSHNCILHRLMVTLRMLCREWIQFPSSC